MSGQQVIPQGSWSPGVPNIEHNKIRLDISRPVGCRSTDSRPMMAVSALINFYAISGILSSIPWSTP